MKFIFDTHTFIWWDSEPSKLSSKVIALYQNPHHILILSVVSLWEMQIKLQLGKLKLAVPLKEIVESQISTNQIEILPIRSEHVFSLENLPSHYKGPFDRLLVAQAIVEGAILLSADANIAKYPVQVIW